MGIKAIKSVDKNKTPDGHIFSYHNMVKINTQQSVQSIYQFIQKIGQGTYAQVYKAKSILTGNIRAIKKIKKTNSPQVRSSLLNQFDILKQLDHPNILKMYQIFQQQHFFYIVTQLCIGKQLFDVILQIKKFRENQACQIFFQIVSAVKILHEHKIMHRDLKPENIMYSRNLKTLKLIDFGSAIFFQNSNMVERKRTGTSYYIAPQVLQRVYNEKCDIWSMGVILYIFLCGQPPFKGKNDHQILKSVFEDQVKFQKPIWSKISQQAKSLLKNMMQRNVFKRFSIFEVLQDPWFKKYIPKKTYSKIQQQNIIKHLNNMKIYQELQTNQIQQGIIIFIINFVKNNNDQSQMMKTFKALDLNGDGVISLHQLKLGISRYLKLGQRQALYVAKKIFQKVDVNNSGSIDYSQFLMSASNIQLTITQQNIDIAFDYIDTDQSGYLSVQQIRQKLGQNLSEQTYQNLLQQFDKNNDGQISRYQFRDMMKSLVRKRSNKEKK